VSSLKTRIPELDGIRGMAILLVLIWHYVVWPIGDVPANPVLRLLSWCGMQTWSGVDLFFVLSGFLIGGILLDAKDSENYFRTFYIRRVFRILPIYVLICASYPVQRAVFPGKPLPAMPWYVYGAFLQDFWLAHHSWNAYLAQTWSLAVEEQFYLTLPAIIAFTPRRHLWKLIAGLAFTSAAVRSIAYLYYYPAWKWAAYTLVICRADTLLLGVLAALAVRSERAIGFFASRKYLLPELALGGVAVVAAMMLNDWGVTTPAMSTFGYSCTALMYAAVLLMAVTAPKSWLGRLFRLGWLRWLGGIAYCLYLVHIDALLIVYRLFGYTRLQLDRWRDLLPLTTALACSLLISHASWKYFESRMVRIGHRFTYQPRTVQAGSSVIREFTSQELTSEAPVQ
jgi:peptidoglycan/LPS O-acetylase OafA/YrhL